MLELSAEQEARARSDLAAHRKSERFAQCMCGYTPWRQCWQRLEAIRVLTLAGLLAEDAAER
jgi:hypothetical protein